MKGSSKKIEVTETDSVEPDESPVTSASETVINDEKVEVKRTADDMPKADSAEELKVEIAPEATDKPAAVESENTSKKLSKSKFKGKLQPILIILFCIVNVGILAATNVMMRIPKKQASIVSLPTTDSSKQQVATTTATKATEKPVTKHYTSDALKLDFDYPSDWRITSNPDSTVITISSAQFDADQGGGSTTPARAEITIYAKYPENNPDVNNDSIVGANSESLTYKSPTKVQRKVTNLTYILPSTLPSAIEVASDNLTSAFVSGNLVYKTGDQVNAKTYKRVNPFIIFEVNACDSLCTETQGVVPMAVDTFQNLDYFKTAKDIIASMRFN
ncbi:MAG TPA: hypothetical protein VLF39_03475 [Candidatus Saccharimonadales bacterium]|nr:hypothetical protein [Candidatus Saccharimonadales bacterium]